MVYPGPSKDLTDHANEFKEDFKFPPNFYFTIDPDYSMTNLYGLRWEAEKETAYPATIIIDKEGKIVYSLISRTHGGRSTTDGIIEVLNKL
jgi:alkyl hydroperoxide reductase subunit AhpC